MANANISMRLFANADDIQGFCSKIFEFYNCGIIRELPPPPTHTHNSANKNGTEAIVRDVKNRFLLNIVDEQNNRQKFNPPPAVYYNLHYSKITQISKPHKHIDNLPGCIEN